MTDQQLIDPRNPPSRVASRADDLFAVWQRAEASRMAALATALDIIHNGPRVQPDQNEEDAERWDGQS